MRLFADSRNLSQLMIPSVNNRGSTSNVDVKLTMKDVEDAIRTLKSLPAEFDAKTKRKILTKAAAPLRDAAKANIPESKEPHHRYSTPKLFGSIGTPNGMGNIIATYFPGNLKRAIQVLRLRKSEDVFVGPRLFKSNPQGEFSGRRVDGWYAHFLEYGTIKMKGIGYMRRAVDAKREIVWRKIVTGVDEVIVNWIRQRRIKNID